MSQLTHLLNSPIDDIQKLGAYLVKGTVGTLKPSAPTMHFTLTVAPKQHKTTGLVEIMQAIEGLNSDVNVMNLSGAIFKTGLNQSTQLITLHGHYN